MNEYKFESDYDSWDDASEQINKRLIDQGISIRNIRKIMMALEEHISNIIKYNDSSVDVKISMDIKEKVEIVIEDNGKLFNPQEISDASVDADVVRNRSGGMGITMVRKLMDETEYIYDDVNGLNIFRMVKCLGEE